MTEGRGRERKRISCQPGFESLVAVIPQLLLLGFVFGSHIRFANSCPRAEVPSLVSQGRGFSSGIELGESTKLDRPQHEKGLNTGGLGTGSVDEDRSLPEC
jgi:hypothetical protein